MYFLIAMISLGCGMVGLHHLTTSSNNKNSRMLLVGILLPLATLGIMFYTNNVSSNPTDVAGLEAVPILFVFFFLGIQMFEKQMAWKIVKEILLQLFHLHTFFTRKKKEKKFPHSSKAVPQPQSLD